MSENKLSARALSRATLARQGLLERQRWTAVEAVGRLAGMQAQEPRHPFVGLWSRVEEFEREELLRALQTREVLRSTWVRATLHLVTAKDYAATRAALAPVMNRAMGAIRDRSEGLDLAATVTAARELLGERPRTFDELRAELQERFPTVNERALGYVVRLHVPLAMVWSDDRWGFPRIAEFTLAPEPDSADPAALVSAYLAAFGPAAPADLQAWSGLPGAQRLFDDHPGLVRFEGENGRTLYDLENAPRPPEDTDAPPRFLPDFDSLVLAHHDRTRFVPEAHQSRLTTKNLRVRATFLLDGIVAGTWTTKATKRRATLTLAPFTRLPAAAKKALSEEGERLLAFSEPDAGDYVVEVE